MPLKSPFPSVEIPDCSIVSYTFTSPTHPLSKDRPLYIDANDTSNFLTHHAYRLYAQRLAAGLRRNGFKPGDRLLLYSGNTIYFPVIVMGVIMAGGIFTGANPTYVAREVAYQLEDSGAKFMLVATSSLDTGLEAASQVGLSKSSVFVFDGQSRGEPVQGTRHWSSLLASEIDGRGFTWDPCTSPEESERTIALNYSSGTTGPPKGVEITHKNYVANCTQVKAHQDRQVKTKEEEENETFLGIIPMYHALGQTWFVVYVPTLAAKCYVMPKFEFEKVMDAIEKFRVTSLSLVPPIVVAMAKHPDVRRGKWDLSSVRTVQVGAAPLGSEACREFDGLFNQNRSPSTEINIKQGWGMTEGTCTLVFFDPTRKSLSYSVGSPLPNTELKFMNDDGTAEVPPHEHGEIWVKAPNVMKGYWRNEKATKETLTPDGWLKSGDIGYFDKDGLVYIVDRRKELIKVKGNQVAPAELEALLLDHPAVNDAAVIGVPHNGDEAPRAYIVLNAGGSATAEEIQSWVEKRVSRHKRLKGGVRFVDQVPKNPSGKILRKFLREKAAKEMKGERPRL
ncbi:MAG: hypothetical protein LQ340_005430 [Diploschistes diacapsis]|nr:MAG: hypothetical protein LQ340_005430 [Diploschistes diacapsis]